MRQIQRQQDTQIRETDIESERHTEIEVDRESDGHTEIEVEKMTETGTRSRRQESF